MATDEILTALGYLRFAPNIDSQDDRIVIQKITYLLKKLGFGINFKFERRSRGPYSMNLDKEMWIYRDEYQALQSPKPTAAQKRILNHVKESVPIEVSRLEGAASAVYLMYDAYPKMDELGIREKLRLWKENFSEEQLTISMNDAKKLMFKEQYVTPELKNELSAWTRLGSASILSQPA